MSELTVVAAPPEQSIGSLVDELYELNQRKAEINKELKDLNAVIEDIEEKIFGRLDQLEIDQVRGRTAKVTVTHSVVPTVKDWEAFHRYVKENDMLYLFERRVSTAAWRELHQSGETVPGTEPFTKRGLSVRKA